jgi:hypothetical protein
MKAAAATRRRLLWFVLLYIASLAAVLALAYGLRALFGLAM